MEALVIKIMGIVIAALVGMFITKIFSDRKLTALNGQLDSVEHILIKIDNKIEDIDMLKEEVDKIYDRLREVESKVAVLESKK